MIVNAYARGNLARWPVDISILMDLKINQCWHLVIGWQEGNPACKELFMPTGTRCKRFACFKSSNCHFIASLSVLTTIFQVELD